MHKLGHGGFSTTWIARDSRLSRNVALKIKVASASSSDNRESLVLRALSRSGLTSESGQEHIMQLLDEFQHNGPNGVHDCLVFELLGPSVASVVERRSVDNRLPGHIAKKACKETCLGLQALHEQGIGHGDLHAGNLVFAVPQLAHLSENMLFENYGHPRTGPVNRADGSPLEPGVPEYLVWPARFPIPDLALEKHPIKLIDFGESFFLHGKPKTLHTPIAVRAPELLFEDEYDLRADLWTLGCTMFELVVGYLPCSSLMAQKEDVLQQIADLIGEPPERWQPEWKAMPKWDQVSGEDPVYTLEEWLDLTYFDDNKRPDFTREEIKQFGEMIRGPLQWEPSVRSSVADILSNEWFQYCQK
ncbi:kinase-like protein [Aureobasidium sp. EXF-10727]|nr:kinase-like protein [Aureobasidium sp. EXF-10727]